MRRRVSARITHGSEAGRTRRRFPLMAAAGIRNARELARNDEQPPGVILHTPAEDLHGGS